MGVLTHLGMAGATVWCKAMGLIPASCCPVEVSEDPILAAPSDCCRPALEPAEPGLGELPLQLPALAALSWGEVVVEDPRHAPSRPEPQARATAPPLALLSTIVIIR